MNFDQYPEGYVPQSIDLTDDRAVTVFAETDGQQRVFIDLAYLTTMYANNLAQRAIVAHLSGNLNDDERAYMLGQTDLLDSLIKQGQHLLDERQALIDLAALSNDDVVTVADFGFTGQDGDLS